MRRDLLKIIKRIVEIIKNYLKDVNRVNYMQHFRATYIYKIRIGDKEAGVCHNRV